MFSTDVTGLEGLVLAFAGLLVPLLGLLVAYLVIRLAVRHGVRDALADRDRRRELAQAERILARD